MYTVMFQHSSFICIVLYCILMYCIVLYSYVLYCIVFLGTVLYCIFWDSKNLAMCHNKFSKSHPPVSILKTTKKLISSCRYYIPRTISIIRELWVVNCVKNLSILRYFSITMHMIKVVLNKRFQWWNHIWITMGSIHNLHT